MANKNKIFTLEISEKISNFYKIKISDTNGNSTFIAFAPISKNLVFFNNDKLTFFFIRHEYQLRKMLHNKKPETYYPGFKVNFVIKNNKQVEAFNDLTKIVVLDRREGNYNIYTKKYGKKNIIELYTDGCYYKEKRRGGYAAIIKNLNGKLSIVWGQTLKPMSSTLLELMAVIKGLQSLNNISQLRINTDSRYVIKGLTEWIENWKLNQWFTIQGKKVKNIEFWKLYDKLTEGKYIEFKWIKAHSQHFENTISDYYAKLAAFYNKKTY